MTNEVSVDQHYRPLAELEAGLDAVRGSSADAGVVELIVRRPGPGQREVVQQGQLDLKQGLLGDNWLARGSRQTSDGTSHPDMQLTMMNSRAIALVAQDKNHWPLAGDQLYVDFDLSLANLPPGTQLAVGSAVLEIADQPHTGCKQFAARFGKDAVKFVNSSVGKQLRLRGLNAKVVRAGVVRVGDVVRKIDASDR
jgi:hypothetical protein